MFAHDAIRTMWGSSGLRSKMEIEAVFNNWLNLATFRSVLEPPVGAISGSS